MFSAASAFALFFMLALASVVYYLSNRFRLPYTVLLTFLGVALVPLSFLEPFHFIREFQLTPELLFFIFLPTLLFESAYNMNIRRVVEEGVPILLLSVVAYLASTFLVGAGLWYALELLGFSVPFLVTLLFGALISATDPVAVLALFKEYGAPRRLTLLFEGESLANDATALALFLVILTLIEMGVTGEGIALGAVTFFTMLIGGVVVGLVVGAIIIRLLGFFRNNEIVAVTLMIVLAHLTFLSAEILNHVMQNAQLAFLQFSPIIATAVASLLMGNYGRFKVTPRAEEFVDKFWTQFAFMANSIIFILIGLLFASLPSGAYALVIPALAAILIVALARAIAIYGTIIPFNTLAPANIHIPWSWQHLLAWGSLRGALAVMMVLLVPASLSVPGWTLDVSVQEFLLVLSVSCIFATLFIKAPTIGPLMTRLRANELTPLETVAEETTQALIHGQTILKLRAFSQKGYIPTDTAQTMIQESEARFFDACCTFHDDEQTIPLARRALKLYLIGLEREELNELFAFQEVSESVFKHIRGKLTLQAEAIERGEKPDPSRYRDWRDIFEHMADRMRGLFATPSEDERIKETLLYYRGQEILARKVLKELRTLAEAYEAPVFSSDMFEEETALYQAYYSEAHRKLEETRTHYPELASYVDESLAFRSMFRVKERYLERYHHRGLLTPKLFIKLRNEYEEEVAQHNLHDHNKKLT